jgi:hypothetical protein
VLWLAIAGRLLRSTAGRRRFLVSGLAAIGFFTAAGLLSAFGVTGRLVVG